MQQCIVSRYHAVHFQVALNNDIGVKVLTSTAFQGATVSEFLITFMEIKKFIRLRKPLSWTLQS